MTDKELEFYSWEQQYGFEEAIRIAAEEWGSSENQVRILAKSLEDITTWH